MPLFQYSILTASSVINGCVLIKLIYINVKDLGITKILQLAVQLYGIVIIL